ncbi:MAG: hypothetical protein C0602_03870 [Denitrovibrio sp.]|nr:MAG: hypothetical protein C0602_03870 [Denitrovibrio sp.]
MLWSCIVYSRMSTEEKIKQAIELLKTNPNQSINLLDDVLADTPHNIDALYNKGMALAAVKKYQEAINYFLKVLQLSPNTALAHVSIGNIANTCGQPLQAIQRYVAAINIDNTLISHFYKWLGTTAQQALRRSVALSEDDVNKAREDMAAAGKAYEVMSQHPSPEVSEIGAYHAGVLFDMMEHERGIEFLQKCKSIEPFKTYAENILKMKGCTHKGSSKKTLIIHAGFPGTAVTWLQSAFFPYMPDTSHIGETFFTFYEPNSETAASYKFPPTYSTDMTQSLSKEDFEVEQFGKIIDASFSKHDTISISDGSLAFSVDVLAQNLLKIEEEMGVDVKVFIMIRNQRDLIKSTYQKNVKAGLWPELPISEIFEKGHEHIEKYDFLNTYNSLKPFDEKGALLILPYEKLLTDNVGCLTVAAAFYGIAEAEVYAEAAVKIPAINRSSKEAESKASELSPDLTEYLSEKQKLFEDSNKQLSQALGIELEKFGYF